MKLDLKLEDTNLFLNAYISVLTHSLDPMSTKFSMPGPHVESVSSE